MGLSGWREPHGNTKARSPCAPTLGPWAVGVSREGRSIEFCPQKGLERTQMEVE